MERTWCSSTAWGSSTWTGLTAEMKGTEAARVEGEDLPELNALTEDINIGLICAS